MKKNLLFPVWLDNGITELVRPEHLKAICSDNDLFHGYVVKFVLEFWETNRFPDTWEICEATVMFKKGKATDPNSYRFIMKLVVAEKLMLVIIGNRLHKLIESKLIESFGAEYESQCGFRARVGCVDAIFALRLSLRKRKEHGYHIHLGYLPRSGHSFRYCGNSSLQYIVLIRYSSYRYHLDAQ